MELSTVLFPFSSVPFESLSLSIGLGDEFEF